MLEISALLMEYTHTETLIKKITNIDSDIIG